MSTFRLHDNEEAYNRYKIRPRILVNVSKVDMWTEIFGTKVFPSLHYHVFIRCLPCLLKSPFSRDVDSSLLILSSLQSFRSPSLSASHHQPCTVLPTPTVKSPHLEQQPRTVLPWAYPLGRPVPWKMSLHMERGIRTLSKWPFWEIATSPWRCWSVLNVSN